MNNFKEIEKLPLAFSQVREDPLVDLNVLRSIESNNCRVLMIASGGDTLAHLASQKNIQSIDAVDANPAQLNLSQLKLKLLEFPTDYRLRILGHHPFGRLADLQSLAKEIGFDLESLGPLHLLEESGPDFAGRYEQLFAAIQNKITKKNIELFNQSFDLISESLKEVYDEFFDLDLLIRLFGKEATQNPVQKFGDHFFERTRLFMSKEGCKNSPFLNQMLLGRFEENLYEWLKLPEMEERAKVSFTRAFMLDHMKGIDSESYDFIHLSNILDWLTESQAEELMRQTRRLLTQGGKTVIRQLNSSLDIKAAGSFFKWETDREKELLDRDKSFFYRALHIGVKND